jgi:hypothetical protein
MAPKSKWNVETASEWINEQGFPYKALKKIPHPKKVIFVFECPNGTVDEYDLADIRRQIATGLIPCKCCRRIARLPNALKIFQRQGLTPLDLERDYNGPTSYVPCWNADGYIVNTQEENSQGVTYSPFIFSNPYAIENVRKLAIDIGFKDLVSEEYVNYDSVYTAVDHDSLLYQVRIGSMLRLKADGMDFTSIQKYVEQSPYLEHNIFRSAERNGYTPLPDTLNAKEKSIGAINPQGYLVVYNPYQLEGAIYKPPNPFHSHNRYYYVNMQKLIQEKGLPIIVDPKRKLGITEEGYFVTLRHEEIMQGKMPQRFHESNPYSMRNIHLYCRLHRPGYRPVKGQVFRDAKTKLYFIYRGRDLKPDTNPVFPVDWGNFKSGKGHPHRLREVCKNGVSNNFRILRQIVSNSEWRKKSLGRAKERCILSGEIQHLEVHHLVRPFVDIVEEAVEKAGLVIKPFGEYTENEKKRIVDEFIIIHAYEPLGVPITRPIHRCFHRWLEKEGKPVDKLSFNEFKKIWKDEFEQWKALKATG